METLAVVEVMTLDEARHCVNEIKRGMADLRYLLLDLDEREGWLTLGYPNICACAYAEFGYEKSHVYRLLDAAKIERNISPAGEKIIPERHLRPLTRIEPVAQKEVFRRAVETAPEGKLTAQHVEKTVTEWKYDQGIQYGEAASTYKPTPPPIRDEDGDTPTTVTLRVARVVYLLALGKWMALDEVAEKTGLTENGAWRLMARLAGGYHVPVTEVDGRWGIVNVDSQDMPY